MDPARASLLLQRYTASQCQDAFREIVEGHAGLVYAAALRITGDAGLAEDVMQTVFAALAARPGAVRDGRMLAAWLHRAASGRAVDAVRTESRRRQREQRATTMNGTTASEHDPLWDAAAPVIDSALGSLGETDRELLLLRFWQRQDLRCIGEAFGLSDDAAQKRIGRALQKLRGFLERRGITGTASALSVALMTSASAAPPAEAVARISAAALGLAQSAPAAAAGTLFTNTIVMTAKTKITITTAAACVAIGTPLYLQQREIRSLREENAALRAITPPRRNTLVTPSMPAIADASQSGSETAEANAARGPVPITAQTRNLGNRSFDPVANMDLTNRIEGSGTLADVDRAGMAEEFRTGLTFLDEGGGSAPMIGGKVQWDHSQATGAPDTPEAGDKPTAWAPKNPRSGEQWLSLGYEQPVEIAEINIQETHSPGAISKVAALMPDGSEKILWQGTADPPREGEDSRETSLPVPPGTTSSQIKVYVDTGRVQSWPEIDAVELIGTNGTRQWASRSAASSSYSERYEGTALSANSTGSSVPEVRTASPH